jgi:hypothetical protein
MRFNFFILPIKTLDSNRPSLPFRNFVSGILVKTHISTLIPIMALPKTLENHRKSGCMLKSQCTGMNATISSTETIPSSGFRVATSAVVVVVAILLM